MTGLVHRIERRAAAAARRLAVLVAAAALAAVGLGFLTSAVWTILAESEGAVFASTALGLGFIGIAAVALGVLSLLRHRRPPPAPRADPAVAAGMLAEAFVAGLTAGRAARR